MNELTGNIMKLYIGFWLLASFIDPNACLALLNPPLENSSFSNSVSRRQAFVAFPIAAAGLLVDTADAKAAGPNGLPLQTAASGLKWADAKVGSGQPAQNGSTVSIDYSMASTVGRQPQIYTTKDKDIPYRWTLGDGSTIQGIEQAILGTKDGDVPPMLPGGVRRVVTPAKLGYESILSESKPRCLEGQDIGPIPPKANSDGAYQRWYQFYCNPRIPYQPDLVMDIKLYGKRSQ